MTTNLEQLLVQFFEKYPGTPLTLKLMFADFEAEATVRGVKIHGMSRQSFAHAVEWLMRGIEERVESPE